MNMNTIFFVRKEVKPITFFSKNRRAHVLIIPHVSNSCLHFLFNVLISGGCKPSAGLSCYAFTLSFHHSLSTQHCPLHFPLVRSCAEKQAVLGLSFSSLNKVDISCSFSPDLNRMVSSHLASNCSRGIPNTSFQGRGLFIDS